MKRLVARRVTTRALAALGAAFLVYAIAPEPVETAEQQRGRGGQGITGGQRGVGIQRGGQRGTGERRGGPSANAAKIQERSYLFDDTNEQLPYSVFVSSKVDPSKKSPLLILLHGLNTPPSVFLPRFVDEAQDAGFIVAAPMGYRVDGWYGANGPGRGRGDGPDIGALSEKDVLNVLGIMKDDFKIDEDRVYLAGNSMGGAGTLYLGIKHRKLWAAIAAGAPAIRTQFHSPKDMDEAGDLPIMIIHGDQDRAVPVEQSRQWVARMKELKLTYEYREIKGGGHADAIATASKDMFKFFDKHRARATTTGRSLWPLLQ